MRRYLMIIWAVEMCLCFTQCKDAQVTEYPETVISTGKQKQFDLAKSEIYKLSVRWDCNCMAVTEDTINGLFVLDTVPLVSLELGLDTIFFRSDTVTYLLWFYLNKPGTFVGVINDEYNHCPLYYGVEYIKDSEVPFRYLIAESSFIDRSALDIDSLEKGFRQCITDNKKYVNKWLLNYFKIE
ncbi:MAG: hypothetical protein IT269_09255 [Saprospiraceae bacterium]|nr:hypothetical protein [Saprospiraceae bacterium]